MCIDIAEIKGFNFRLKEFQTNEKMSASSTADFVASVFLWWKTGRF
jgi:hypothetical protein